MFALEAGRDERAGRVTRRMFLGGAAVVAGGAAVAWWMRAPGVEASEAVHGTPGMVRLATFGDDGRRLGEETVAKVVKTDGEWFRELGKNSYGILREADTEMAYTGVSWREHRHGLFRCAGCGTALFRSEAKYDSGTGWPSFWEAAAKENVVERVDRSYGMDRTEVRCARCEGHLGHLFEDGPEPTGLRYCMNSASMQFLVG